MNIIRRKCRVCQKVFQKGLITEYDYCPECLDLYYRGYVALVEVDYDKSRNINNMEPGDAHCTGKFYHLLRDEAKQLINPDYPGSIGDYTPMMYMGLGVVDAVRNLNETINKQATEMHRERIYNPRWNGNKP